MLKKVLLLVVFPSMITAQNDRKIFFGKIYDDLGVLENVHIINIKTKRATYTNILGEFEIFAKVSDSLKITCVGYKTKTLTLNSSDFGINGKQIQLIKDVIELDEIEIKQNNLTGHIVSDIKQVPKDRIKAMTNNIVISIKNLNFDAIINMPIGKDELHLQKVAAPSIPNSFGGVAVASASLPDYDGIRKRAQRKEITFKEQFPEKLLSEFGSHFFFVELKIPKEKYHHFLEYCNTLDIEKLYKRNKKFKLIQIFNNESKSYLKIINQKD